MNNDASIENNTLKQNDTVTASVKAKRANKKRSLSLKELVMYAPAQLIDKYIESYDKRVLAKIFGDEEIIRTAKSFFDNNLNVSKAAKAMYMHRNTLMYRLNKIKKLTGLDIKSFNDAIAFQILSAAYALKWRNNESN